MSVAVPISQIGQNYFAIAGGDLFWLFMLGIVIYLLARVRMSSWVAYATAVFTVLAIVSAVGMITTAPIWVTLLAMLLGGIISALAIGALLS